MGTKILEYMGLRERKMEIVSCPSCGRAQVDVWELAEKVENGLEDITAPIRVAVMGCVVNGPGEAREADLGVLPVTARARFLYAGKWWKPCARMPLLRRCCATPIRWRRIWAKAAMDM